MPGRLRCQVAMSLDGFIAASNGEHDCLLGGGHPCGPAETPRAPRLTALDTSSASGLR